MEHLSKLFGSPARVKLLRLFIFNPEEVFDRDAVMKLSRITPETASKELASLARAGIVKRKNFYKEVVRPGSKSTKKRKTIGWVLDNKYIYLDELIVFMRDSLSVLDSDIKKRFRGVGSIKLLILSGFFTNVKNSIIEILLVGDRLKERSVENVIHSLEAEYGHVLRYTIFSVEEYKYRLKVRDKFVRDVLDFPHKKVIDKITKT